MPHTWKTLKQKLLPRSLYGRSLMIIVMPILLMQMIVAYIFIDRHWESMSDKLVFALSGEIRMITGEIEQAKSPEEINRIIKLAAPDLDLDITMENRKDAARLPRISEGIALYSVEEKLQKSLADNLKEPFTISAHPKDRWFEVNVRIDKNRTISFVSYNRRLVSPATYVFMLWLVGSSIVLLAVAVAFMRNQIRPIHRLALAAEKLGKGQDLADFKIEGAREVRQAARAFLDMRDRIRRQIDQRTAMLAGVSHDLRTPLTRMKLQLAMLKKSAENDNLSQDLEEMEKMLEGYLTFARGEGNEPTEMVDMKTVLERITGNARRQGYKIETDYAGQSLLRVRPVAIERALANIVSNACKYAKHVWISLQQQPEALEIFVDDDGPGIPKDQRDEVFKPFYRLEKSRNPKTGGIGLGLSIAQDIVHGHGGEIFLEESGRGGLRVVVRLPV
jgi:two-component system osmolarity sensor histidine kinase EnvZ